MNLREFWRFHFLKALLVLVAIQLGIFAWLQVRNHRPIAINDEISVIEGKSVKIQPLRNDTDKDEDNELRLKQVSTPLHGKITQKDKSLNYLADLGYVGVDSFTYVINDGKKDSKAAYIKISIFENLKPNAIPDYAQLYAGNKTVLNPLANDNDKEGDSIFIQDFTQTLHGKLERVGNEFVYTSANTLAYTDSFQYTLSDGYHASDKVSVVIEVKGKNDAAYPWFSGDIGNTDLKGSAVFKNNSLVVKASGSDIWDGRDGFNFTYQRINGDCEILTKVVSIENTNEWAKAGVIIRESLTGESKNAFIGLSSQHGSTFQRRENNGEGSEGFGGNEDIEAPYWVKLVRKDNNFTAYISTDGKVWEDSGTTEVAMSENVFVGLCVTSHDNSKICEAVFSSFSLKGKAAKY